MPRHFRRRWHESRGDEYDAWGPATYWFEVDADLSPLRQIESYDGGQRLLYHRAHTEDAFGMLGSEPLEWDPDGPFAVTATEFEAEWSKGRST